MVNERSRSLELFRRRAAFFRAGKLTKLLGAPLRMGYSAAVSQYCRATNRVVRTAVRTFWGARMNLVFPERGSLTLYRYNFIEEGLTSIFLSQVKPGMTVFDIGAHFGYFTLLSAWIVGQTGQVHSFEPTPSTFAVLRENAAGYANVRLNNVAAFSRSDELTFQDFGLEFSQFNSLTDGRLQGDLRSRVRPRPYKVKAVPLDEYVAETGARPDLIKIDAENAEYDILQGAQRVLSELRPMITLEVGDIVADDAGAVRESSAPVRLLSEHGYRAFEFAPDTGGLRAHQPRASYTYDNLLMVPEEKSAAVATAPAPAEALVAR